MRMCILSNWFSLALLCLCFAGITGCERLSSPTPPATSNETTPPGDEPNEEARRFVTLSPALGVMLRDLGFEDSIVGRHSYDSALSRSIPSVGSQLELDYELLITLDPTDILIERNTIGIPEQLQSLADKFGWNLWTYQLESLDDIAITLDDLYLKLVGFPEDSTQIETGLGEGIPIHPGAKLTVELPSARLAQSWSPMGRVASDAGRMLVLAGIDPPGAMGPGSFHGQLIERLGVTPALSTGGMWQELDYEDIINLAPDSILVFAPRAHTANDQIGEPVPMSWGQIKGATGGIAELPIPAVENQRIAIIEHPLGLLPSSSFGQVADEVRAEIEAWAARDP